MTLGRQLWFPGRNPRNQEPRPGSVGPPSNRRGFGVKPRGGMWTSSEDDKENWPNWCHGEGMASFVNRIQPWALTPDPGAKVYQIDTYEDLRALWTIYPLRDDPTLTRLNTSVYNRPEAGAYRHEKKWIDWAKVAESYDAVHLTAAGQWATRMPGFDNPSAEHGLDLYGWDCESTWWARWKFLDKMPLPRIRMPYKMVRENQRNARRWARQTAYFRRTGKLGWEVNGEMVEMPSSFATT